MTPEIRRAILEHEVLKSHGAGSGVGLVLGVLAIVASAWLLSPFASQVWRPQEPCVEWAERLGYEIRLIDGDCYGVDGDGVLRALPEAAE